MTQRSQPIALILLVACIVLQGCQSVKKTLGIERDPPMEYCVKPSEQPLEMPPDFSCLPLPVPGMERPQDQAARQVQKEKFLGSSGAEESLSPAQKTLLEMCGAESNQDHIRSKVNEEALTEAKKPKPIIEKLGIKTIPIGDVVDPHKEAARLEEQQRSSAVRQVMPSPKQRHSRQQQKRGQRGTLSLTPENLSPIEPEENLGNLDQ